MPPVLRIAIDDGVAYVAWGEGAARTVRLSGKMRREIRAGRAPRPVVGDYVTVSTDGLVERLEPRRTRLARRAIGVDDAAQVIAANVDVAFIATASGQDVSERRLERYLSVVHDGGVHPVVLLTKVDVSLAPAVELARVRAAVPGVDVLAVSAATGEGLAAVRARVGPGLTAALLGSSGVGKSTLVNALVGEARQETAELRADGKGRHTTTRRQLFVLPGGGLLLDTPGMRELGLQGADEGLAEAFSEVTDLAARCHYRDCSHGNEPGCAVQGALARGALARDRYEAWTHLRDESGGARPRRR